jgi:hypothetical protein
MIKETAKAILPASAWHHFKRAWLQVQLRLWRHDLSRLAELYGTDKWGLHRYTTHYQTHFSHLRSRSFNLLEIGVGGHDAPDIGGASLRMWKAFFPRANIYAIDIFDKSGLQEPRISIFKGSAADTVFLRSLVERIGRIDVVIDDGSHINEHVRVAFETLFPLLPDGAIYAIEDLQTSYWPPFGGSEDPLESETSMAMLKRLADGLNWEEFSHRASQPFDAQIVSVHFYHNLAFIYKGQNNEGTNKDMTHTVHRETREELT